MKSAGCWRVRIGIETGSKKLMQDLRKPVNLDEVPEIFSLLRKYKLRYSPSIILGLPNSNINDVYATLDLIKRIKTDPAHCTISMSTFLYPGTDYFENFKKENIDFKWENTSEKYKKRPCIMDIYGNYLFPITTFPSEIFKWKCHLLYISYTFSGHPFNSLKRLFSLICIFWQNLLKNCFGYLIYTKMKDVRSF